jgi:hypothetical protein
MLQKGTMGEYCVTMARKMKMKRFKEHALHPAIAPLFPSLPLTVAQHDLAMSQIKEPSLHRHLCIPVARPPTRPYETSVLQSKMCLAEKRRRNKDAAKWRCNKAIHCKQRNGAAKGFKTNMGRETNTEFLN